MCVCVCVCVCVCACVRVCVNMTLGKEKGKQEAPQFTRCMINVYVFPLSGSGWLAGAKQQTQLALVEGAYPTLWLDRPVWSQDNAQLAHPLLHLEPSMECTLYRRRRRSECNCISEIELECLKLAVVSSSPLIYWENMEMEVQSLYN